MLEKITKLFINFCDLKRIIFGPSANFYDEIVKTAFYLSKETFCRKKLNSWVPYFEKHIQGFLARNKNYSRLFPKLHSACVERVWENISRFFLFLSRVSELDTSSEEKIFKEKYIALEKSLYLPFYVSLTELHLRVQRNVLFRSTLLELFPSVHDFETNVIGFGKTFLNFVFENVLYVTTRSSKSMFLFWKNHTFVYQSRFVSKNVRFFY